MKIAKRLSILIIEHHMYMYDTGHTFGHSARKLASHPVIQVSRQLASHLDYNSICQRVCQSIGLPVGLPISQLPVSRLTILLALPLDVPG